MSGPKPGRLQLARPQLAAAASAGSFLATFALIAAAIGGFFAVDTFLAGLERSERRSEAVQRYREGMTFIREGRTGAALDRLGTAVSLERDNPVYQRALAEAFLGAGKLPDAATLLAERLQQAPTDAAASLLLARVLVRQGKIPEAISYYHRAIYGQWPDSADARRTRARFELVDLLARQDAKRELLAELLPLQSEAPGDLATRKRIARLFTAAGSPTRAIEIFRDLLQRDPDDAGAHAGLGDAEFEHRNYRTARREFQTARRLAPGDSAIAARLALADRVLALDPMQRGLGTAAMYARSRTLVELAEAAVTGCLGADSTAPAHAGERALVDTAAVALAARPRPSQDAVEENLELAERLWQARRTACPQAIAPAEEPLRLVLERLAQ